MPSDLFCIRKQSVERKIFPPRGEGRLNCRDTRLAQNPPRRQRRCGVKRSFHIVGLYIKSHAAEWERGVFVWEIMSIVYDKSVNSLEIIASELSQGDCNPSRGCVFSFGTPKRGGRSVLTPLNLYFEKQIWWFSTSTPKAVK